MSLYYNCFAYKRPVGDPGRSFFVRIARIDRRRLWEPAPDGRFIEGETGRETHTAPQRLKGAKGERGARNGDVKSGFGRARKLRKNALGCREVEIAAVAFGSFAMTDGARRERRWGPWLLGEIEL